MSRGCLFVLCVGLLGCTSTVVPTAPSGSSATTGPRSLDRAIESGCQFLIQQTEPGGPIRSDVYATFRDGTALTPLVVAAWQDDNRFQTAPRRTPAALWLARKVQSNGTIDEGADGFPYPLYTAALTVQILSHRDFRQDDPDVKSKRDAWVRYLLERQLTESLGWQPADLAYGGWGYYPRLPRKPAPGQIVPAQQLLESNLSATVFALDALVAAGVTDPKILKPALHFVRTCQNADGGFHFIAGDPVRNKAGIVDPNANPLQFHSYGSATADGVRALLLCGLPTTDPAVVAGRDWLVRNFSAEQHPGTYLQTHERNRNAVYFYYARSVSRTFRRLGETEVQGQPWARTLSDVLIARQEANGSWVNPADQQRENDPILATAYAVATLAHCRETLAGR